MIKKKAIKWIWLIVILLLLTNWQGFKNITGLNDLYYRYSNSSGTFTASETPSKGRVFKMPPKGKFILNRPNFYECKNIPQTDTAVYRLFAINPLKFWRWGEYIFNWRYRLPYSNWELIKQKRETGYMKIYKGCMEF